MKQKRYSYSVIGAVLLGAFGVMPAQAQDQVPFTMVIAQTPWYPAFESVVDHYEQETGNKVVLDVNPSPALMDKVRNSARASEGEFDLLAMNALTLPEYYFGGYVTALTDIDPEFSIEDGIINYGGSANWNPDTRTIGEGAVYGVPINGNIQLLYYRADLYEENGLQVPATWDELKSNAAALNGDGHYGMVVRGNRSFADSSYNFFPYMASYGGGFMKPDGQGGYVVTANSPETLAALDMWTGMAADVSAPDAATVSQSKMIELLATGKAAQAVMVAAAWPQLEDPNKSAVVGKMAVAPLPAGPAGPRTTLGHWMAGIAGNVPKDRQQAALAFLKWFQTREAQQVYLDAGGIPVRSDIYAENSQPDGPNRWMGAMAESDDMGVPMFVIPEGVTMVSQIELRLQQALLGEVSNARALDDLADDIAAILEEAGYPVTRLAPLS
ncbi:extracellular solute-binding protein [Paracoccus seriniphilus]|uniref:extracellular solute-binding protein n=1 Tax=Paracoccus seriniphilus TaxID=184748 RepID=UPI00356AE99D